MPATKFSLGHIVMTAGIAPLVESAAYNDAFTDAMIRHSMGDWGDVDAEDKQANDRAVQEGGRILSAYKAGTIQFWIITEGDRTVTTLLLPDEY